MHPVIHRMGRLPLFYIAFAVCVLLSTGCTLPNRQVQPPRTMGQQQLEATQWDPYADIDGGPEIVGGRPREFQRPPSQPIRASGFRDTRWPF